MNIVSIINYKGGVGKTTTTANLAAELAFRGKNVLVLDLDAQASLTFSFIRPDDWQNNYAKEGTIKSWFDSFSSNSPILLESLIISPTDVNNGNTLSGTLDLIPSHLGLINVDLELATELGGANVKQSKLNFLKVHKRLLDGIKALPQDKYDIILIDCPPNFNIVTKTVIVASNKILIPAKPDYLSTMGIDYLIRSLNTLVQEYNEYANYDADKPEECISPEIIGVVFTMIQIRNNQPISAQRPYIQQVNELQHVNVFKTWIRENKTLFSDAPEYGIPVVLSRNSGQTYKNIVTEIENFVTEFQDKIGLD